MKIGGGRKVSVKDVNININIDVIRLQFAYAERLKELRYLVSS